MYFNFSKQSSSSDRLVITHWNCFQLPSRIPLLEKFLAQNCPDIVLLNEIKINQNDLNFYFNFKNYNSIVKARNCYGGGLSILIKEGIDLYNPPNIVLPFELFLDITKRCGKFILGGDLNAKAKSLGCFGENENGQILEKILSKLNLSVFNDKTPTFNRFKFEHFEILDLFLIPSSLADKILDFKLLQNHDMLNDHFPIQAYISIEHYITVKSPTNWGFFQELLRSSRLNINSLTNIDKLNELISLKIMNAAQKSIPFQSQKFFKSSLPKNIVILIKERRKVLRLFQKTRCPSLKMTFNKLTSELRSNLKDFLNQNWHENIRGKFPYKLKTENGSIQIKIKEKSSETS
ncbi:RNA-directed DNA polymerase from transposon X [Brachionus plicatilis]|uniref:RNA-directed DNA polymerase from transposon X n=1 Tax=Brachionus plicatilis TaxID=10195 RepID=A0A3M7PT21_BRAPC|nr:RNA-directed DNA polymerase from transposon X [Brachionus plicatilis]